MSPLTANSLRKIPAMSENVKGAKRRRSTTAADYDTPCSISLPGWKSSQGESHRLAQLTEADVWEIKFGDLTIDQVLAKFNISRSHANAIRRGKRWTHVTRATQEQNQS